MIKVSIIVPVCNVAPYLQACMDSLVCQTLREIEILCYDDCSDDGSGEILDEYAQRDDRVHVVHYPDNRTAAQARKDGALRAEGQYILYVDGDDSLELNACERLSELMDMHQVDMIHFGTTVVHDGSLPESRIANLEKMLEPYGGKLKGSILNECFVKCKFHYQIWNKIFQAKLCKRAMAMFPDGRYSKAQDLFAFYLIAFFAQTYLGVPKEKYYIYGFGRGVTGHQYIGRKTIERFAEQALVVKGIEAFLSKLNVLEVYRDSLNAVTDRLLNDSMGQMYHHVQAEDIPFAFEKMCEQWGVPTVVGHMAEKQLYQSARWAQLLKPVDALNPSPRRARKIGTFYHSLCNGGAQRVVAELAGLWTKMGYEVVLFTDSEPTAEDYETPASCKRVVLPEFALNNPAMRKQRMEVLYQSVKELELDLFIMQAWVASSVLWDMLCVKMAGAMFYVHTHSVFSMPLLSNSITNRFFEMQHVYVLADGVIALSDTDRAYWKYFNSRVFTVVNPLTFDLENCAVNPLTGKTILWLGRISNEKNPIQAVEIFARVHAEHPDAKMMVVGSGSEKLEGLMKGKITELGLDDCVEMCGFHTDVEPFYQQADVFLSTSSYEGFPLTILEAQSHGIPCVAYNMPYLTLFESGRGSFCVPMGDKDGAANVISHLLNDREQLQRSGREARQNVEATCLVDYQKMWESILTSTQEPKEPVEDTREQRVIETLSAHMKMMYDAQQRKMKSTGFGSRRDVTLDELRFAPMPKRGPFKVIRRKIHTALRIWVIEGWSSVKEVIREKRHK